MVEANANIDADEEWRSVSVDERRVSEVLVVDVEGFEGPLDLLLTMARTQKVDMRNISALALAEQYLAFIERARGLRIELAADYLVMAAWLAFLKSRLLLPPDPDEQGPSGEEMAARLAFQLERLAAMRDAAARLMARDMLGRDVFARGVPENVERVRKTTYTATINDIVQAYARIRTKDNFRPFVMDRKVIYRIEDAVERIRGLIGTAVEWTELSSYLPEGWIFNPEMRRSATASLFAATLELAKVGAINIRQDETFAPIEIRRRDER